MDARVLLTYKNFCCSKGKELTIKGLNDFKEIIKFLKEGSKYEINNNRKAECI